jgi:hypothetical protein
MQGDQIARELIARGHAVAWVGFNGDQDIGIEVQMLPGKSPGWQKAFARARVEANADTFAAEIAKWKAKVLSDIRADQPSQTVRDAIAIHGREAVLEMLGAVQ